MAILAPTGAKSTWRAVVWAGHGTELVNTWQTWGWERKVLEVAKEPNVVSTSSQQAYLCSCSLVFTFLDPIKRHLLKFEKMP
jgi:hypothetical protein